MTQWRPQPSPARFIFPACALLCAFTLVWLWERLSARTTQVTLDFVAFLLGLALFFVMLLIGVLVYLTWYVFSIRYTLDDKELVVSCGGVRRVIPLNNISEVYEPGQAIEGKSVLVRWRGIRPFIPGYAVGEGTSRQLGKVISVATTPIERQALVRTSAFTLGLSPQDSSEFVAQLKKARLKALGPDESEDVRSELSGPDAWGAPLWSDPVIRGLLLIGLTLNILLFGYLSLVYGALPDRLALHWNAQADIDRIGAPVELLRLPLFAAGVWFVNVLIAWWAARRERAVSLFLLAGGAAAQLVFWAGTMSIVLRAT